MNNNLIGLLCLVAGLLLGYGVGYVATTSVNQSQAVPAASSPGPVKGDEKLPAGHPNISEIDVEKEVQAALDFGKQNQDYDSQLRVGSFLYMEVRRLEQAKPFFQKAHELKPEEFEPLMQLGNIAFDMSQEKGDPKLMEEAGAWYEKALKIKPDDINVRTDYGITFFLRQPPDYRKAIIQYDKSLEKDPRHAPTLYNKIRAQLAIKDLAGAEATFATLKETKPQEELIKRIEAEMAQAKGGVKIPTH